MSAHKQSISLSVFTFGALPRLFIIAIVTQGTLIFSYLQFTSSGLVEVDATPNYLPTISFVAVIASAAAFFFSKRIARSSYSPILHKPKIPYLAGFAYLVFGWFVTGVAFLVHSILLGNIHWPGSYEIGFGLSIGAAFGSLILFYIDHFGFEHPNNRYELEEAINSIQNQQSELEKSEKAPIELSDSYEALGDLLDRIEEFLRESNTDGGKRLARDIDNWLEEYQDKPEVSQAAIVDRTRRTDEQDLSNLESEFDSILKRLERISNHG